MKFVDTSAYSAVAAALFWYGIAPLWLGAGLADWFFHRRTCIESTSGLPESTLHLAMLAQIGIPALAVVFLEINALVLALVLAGLLVHTLTTYADLAYTHPRREIGAGEQMAHCLLAVLPLLAACFLGVFSWPKVLALLGWAVSDWRVVLRSQPIAPPIWGFMLGIAAIGVGGLNLEEWVRCWRYRRRTAPPAMTPTR